MTVGEICSKLNWKIICGESDREVTGCYIGDLLSRVMARCGDADIWITVQTSKNMIAVAQLADVSAVLFPEGIKASAELVGWAEEEGITLLGFDGTAFEAARGLAGLPV